jgi:NADP-dependent 3-hydroxy acid dehydrogenase YdfG
MHFVISIMLSMLKSPQSNTASDIQVNKRRSIMFAITGITGKVGGAVARSLLAQGQKVRAVVRDAEKGRSWSAQGCDIGIASLQPVSPKPFTALKASF